MLASIVVTTGPPAKAWTPPTSPLQRCKSTSSPAAISRKALLGDISGDRKEGTQWAMTVATLLSLQLGWGLWLMPSVYARCPYVLPVPTRTLAARPMHTMHPVSL